MARTPQSTAPTAAALSRVGPLLREFPDGYEARVVREGAPGHTHEQPWILLSPEKWAVATGRAAKGGKRKDTLS